MTGIARGASLAVLACAACATDSIREPGRPAGVVTAWEDAKFVAVVPGRPDSPEFAVLWGDPRTGPSAMHIRLRKGALPMHVHSSDYHLVVLQGTLKHWEPGETEDQARPLGPGSHWFQPGNVPHADSCLSETCVAYLVWSGPHDGRPAETAGK
jgi:quercetin dioxygenase-like cupin family protein